MSMGPEAGAGWLVLAEIGLFWGAVVVHLLRLFAGGWLPDVDPAADLGHAVMGCGMVYMVFPGASTGVGRGLAFGFGGVAGWFAVRAVRGGGSRHHPGQYAAIAVGQAVTAVMLGVGQLATPVAGVLGAALVGCAVIHGRRWAAAHQWRGRAGGGGLRGDRHVFVTLPHLGAVATTLAMAAMLVAG